MDNTSPLTKRKNGRERDVIYNIKLDMYVHVCNTVHHLYNKGKTRNLERDGIILASNDLLAETQLKGLN